MIVADFSRENGGFVLRIVGHAGYGNEGEDVVCAAVSGIFYALCGYLLNFKRDQVSLKRVESGFAEISCSEECEDYLQLVCLGLLQIAIEYPRHVKVNIGAWEWRLNPPVAI